MPSLVGAPHGASSPSAAADRQPPSFAIVGTGRSGSGFISRLLRAAGVNCGHEEWWGPGAESGPGGLDGDSSWLAVPRLGDFPGPVLHQVRHPLDVVRSLVGIRMFSNPEHTAFRWFMYAHVRGLTGDDVLDSMRWYVDWNRRCEQHAAWRYRVEDVDTDLVVRITEAVGFPITHEVAAAALDEVPTTFNHRRRAELSWDDLPAGELRDQLAEIADAYGYDL